MVVDDDFHVARRPTSTMDIDEDNDGNEGCEAAQLAASLHAMDMLIDKRIGTAQSDALASSLVLRYHVFLMTMWENSPALMVKQARSALQFTPRTTSLHVCDCFAS